MDCIPDLCRGRDEKRYFIITNKIGFDNPFLIIFIFFCPLCYNLKMKVKGYIQVYTGNGKGKTTAALGLALRAAGCGLKTYIGQFMKKAHYSEVKAIESHLSNHIKLEQYGLPGFHTQKDGVTPEERAAAEKGMLAIEAAIQSTQYDVIIMDEINILLYFKILEPQRVLELLDQKPPNLEMVLTGRNAPQEIMDKADLVTEMKEVKHYYTKGVEARKGIEK